MDVGDGRREPAGGWPGTASEAGTVASAVGDGVFRPYGAPGGLKDEFEQLAAEHPDITKLVTIGQTVQGEDIVALKVSRHASRLRDGRRPATLFVASQHGNEWITPEMVRRLARHVIDGYRTDPMITDLVDTTELWFVPVANPDGYDYTFTPGNRLWRKNLRDNDGDGRITANDGVDLNRNYPTKWGYDDEGSSPNGGSQAYRGTGPASEPETQALDRLMARVGFEFLVNYHSASESVLYGTYWQVATPTPDDALYEAIAGDNATPAVPGYGSGLSADLYTGNGILDEHAHLTYGTLGLLVEMSTCQTVSASDPTDTWEPAGCTNAFLFPDDEALIEAEFRKNVPFALATAQSAADPADPVTVTGRQAPEFVVDSFDVSYGDPQTVAVTARRDQHNQRLEYRVNGGRTRRAHVGEWKGGERYGDERDRYYAELRGKVTGTRPGDSVEVWFTARRDGRHVESEHFTYKVASDSNADALILASEDYTGVNPTYPAGTAAPKYADEYAAALDANGITHATWDVDAQGVPHPLGVLSHFDVVVWETGDDRLVQDPEDALTDTFLFGPLPDIAVAERQQYLTIALRDYLNEGGKLVHAGENTQYFGLLGRSLGGIYYGLDGAPDQDCVITSDFLSDCLLLSDDFAQYYLGAANRATFVRPSRHRRPRPARRRDGRARRAGSRRQPARQRRRLLPDQRRAAGRRLPAVRRRGDQHVPRGGHRQSLRPGGRIALRGRPQGAGVIPADRPHARPDRHTGHGNAHTADEAVLQHPAGVPPRDRGGGTIRHRRMDHAARPQRANLAGAAGHRVPTASCCHSTPSFGTT